MLTEAENEILTRVGRGTPCGELLRRYWYPIAPLQELTPQQPTRFVRILGEDFVLFLDKSGRAGLLADHCSHRSASLLYGRVEERGIACAYHGWLYDTQGNILEMPPERLERAVLRQAQDERNTNPAHGELVEPGAPLARDTSNSAIMKSVKQTAYPVQTFVGLYWAYLGPLPAPVLPKYDVWTRRDGRRQIKVQPMLDCNWLQPTENSNDPAHSQILHQNAGGRKVADTTRGRIDDVEAIEFDMLPYGIMKRRVMKSGHVDEHPHIFPNILRHYGETQVRVPVDDTHTYIVWISFTPTPDGSIVEETGDMLPVEYMAPHKYPPEQSHPYARYTMLPEPDVQPQDTAMWETQGPIANRTVEHLSYSDRGVVAYRRLLKENIERVQAGLDPMGVIRDPDHATIDTNLSDDYQVFLAGHRAAATKVVGSRQ